MHNGHWARESRADSSDAHATKAASSATGAPYDESMVSVPKTPLAPQIVTDWLSAIGFVAPSAGSSVWTITHAQHSYSISVCTDGQGDIRYGSLVGIGRGTVTNLLDLENLVVLECVSSLLATGYAPGDITLEKSFRLGRGNGGHLDILVTRNGVSYLMIECKTAGTEYDSELARLKASPNSQLMSYLQQDGDAEQVVLYSSTVLMSAPDTVSIERVYAGFSTALMEGRNLAQIFSSWDKSLYGKGLLESAPYAIAEKKIRVGDLADMTQPDGGLLFNGFKEILRRHAVSDNPNAFNKIFNLFICKIQDEDKSNASSATEFQWNGSETATAVLDRLSDLYVRGMKEYLDLDMADHSTSDLDSIPLSEEHSTAVKALFAEVRQYNNTNFAFIDVFDRASYQQNALIVRDIVRLLQNKRLRYTEKHGFMGMFFEKLLNTSMKQESGQFFTPPPIAQFVNEALPIEAMVKEKIAKGDRNFLPYAIDYAAGSGHFLTEFMDRTDKVLQGLLDSDFTKNAQKANAKQWATGLAWAGEFVYGIELDYRLAKAAKISTFLNGDGAAHVIRGNGLGHFHHDVNYARVGGKIWRATPAGKSKDLPNFDVVVANPPYSVSEFISGVEHGEESFELFDKISLSSDKIETLFVERTKQLLKDGGVAGIVLPTSLLSNAGVEQDARKILLRYFDIVAIVSIGERVFIATTTPTSIVFLRRKPNSVAQNVQAAISTFFADKRDSVIGGVANGIADYAQAIHGASFDEYVDAIENPIGSDLTIIHEYEWAMLNTSKRKTPPITRTVDAAGAAMPTKLLNDFIVKMESARIEAYFITRGKNVIHVQAPLDVAGEREFLGYKFSSRQKHEGISLLSGTELIETPLFDPVDPNNPEKISTLIKTHFTEPVTQIPSALRGVAELVPLADIVSLSDLTFEWSLAGSSAESHLFSGPTARLGTVCHLAIGGTPSRDVPQYFRGTNPWLTVKEMTGTTVSGTAVGITDDAVANSNVKLVKKGTLLMSFKLTIGKTAIAGTDMYTNEAIVAIVPKPNPVAQNPWVDTAYLHALLEFLPKEILRYSGQGRKKIGQSLNTGYLMRVRVPLLDDAGRKDIVQIAEAPGMERHAKAALIWSRLTT